MKFGSSTPRVAWLVDAPRGLPNGEPTRLGGGASSRFEAYLCGAPSVHMGIDFERAKAGGREHTLIEVPDLLVPPATAYDPDGYLELCRRCLYEEAFADRVRRAQLEVARHVGDAGAWWSQLLDCHADWRRGGQA